MNEKQANKLIRQLVTDTVTDIAVLASYEFGNPDKLPAGLPDKIAQLDGEVYTLGIMRGVWLAQQHPEIIEFGYGPVDRS